VFRRDYRYFTHDVVDLPPDLMYYLICFSKEVANLKVETYLLELKLEV